MKSRGAQEPFEMRGVFWLPETKEQHVSGTLHFSPNDGVELRLIEQFGDFLRSPPVVHGIVEDAECTLFACTARRLKSSALKLAEFRADVAIIGALVSSVEEAVFSNARVRFDCLDDWVGFAAFSVPDADFLRGGSPSRFDICEQAKVPTTVDSLGCTISLVGDQHGAYSRQHINWEHHSFLDIACLKLSSVHDLRRTVSELRHLISLLTWQRVRLAYLCFASQKQPAGYDSGGNPWCGVFGVGEAQTQAYHASQWMLTEFSDVRTYFPAILRGWFAGDGRLRDARGLLTELIESEGKFLEFEFLALVQIAEALHRIRNPRRYMSEADYESVKSALNSAIPLGLGEDHRQSLKSKIKYGNELTLRMRLKELCLELPDKLRSLFVSDPASFTSTVVDGRNYLTHRDEELASRELKPEQLRRTCQVLKLLLTIHFFHDLGIPFDGIERISRDRHWCSRQIAH
jgi:hypothetical protein